MLTALQFGAYLALVGGLLICAWCVPASAVAGFMCILAIDHWGALSSPYLYFNSWITNVAIGAIVTLALMRTRHLFGDGRIALPWVKYLSFCLIAYAVMSTLWSPYDKALSVWLTRWPYHVLAIFLIPLLLTSSRDALVVTRTMAVLGAALGFLFTFGAEWQGRLLVVPHAFGEMLKAPLDIAQAGGLIMLAAVLGQQPSEKLWFILRWAAILLATSMVVLSGSRGQFLFMLAIAAILLPICRPRRNLAGYIGLIIGVSAVLGAGFYFYDIYIADKNTTRWTVEQLDTDMIGRIRMAEILLSHWWSQPFTLVFGLGNSASFSPSIIGFYPHIGPLEILGEEGLFGIAMYLSILILTLRNSAILFRLTRTSLESRAITAVLVGWAFFSWIVSLKQGSLALNFHVIAAAVLIEKYCILVKRTDAEASNAKLQTKFHNPKYPQLVSGKLSC